MSEISKQELINLMRAWINRRPGLDPANYGFPAYNRESWLEARRSYNNESRRITQQKHDAETLLRAVELSGMSAEDIKAGFRAFSGRLQLTETEKGYRLDYCAGQYWPTEYRAAAAAVLASALWDYYREDTDNGDSIRAKFRRLFGKSIQRRWFD